MNLSFNHVATWSTLEVLERKAPLPQVSRDGLGCRLSQAHRGGGKRTELSFFSLSRQARRGGSGESHPTKLRFGTDKREGVLHAVHY